MNEERPALAPGMEGGFEAQVRHEWTRAFYEPRLPAVFSTPAMIALMESAISRAVAPTLEENTFTVGTRVDVEHLKAIPVGATVFVSARLAEIAGRRLLFEVEARSGETVIGRGRITHVIVSLKKFSRIAGVEDTPQDKK